MNYRALWLPNDGAEAVADRLSNYQLPIPLGLNTENGRNIFAENCNTSLILKELASLEIACPVFL